MKLFGVDFGSNFWKSCKSPRTQLKTYVSNRRRSHPTAKVSVAFRSSVYHAGLSESGRMKMTFSLVNCYPPAVSTSHRMAVCSHAKLTLTLDLLFGSSPTLSHSSDVYVPLPRLVQSVSPFGILKHSVNGAQISKN